MQWSKIPFGEIMDTLWVLPDRRGGWCACGRLVVSGMRGQRRKTCDWCSGRIKATPRQTTTTHAATATTPAPVTDADAAAATLAATPDDDTDPRVARDQRLSRLKDYADATEHATRAARTVQQVRSLDRARDLLEEFESQAWVGEVPLKAPKHGPPPAPTSEQTFTRWVKTNVGLTPGRTKQLLRAARVVQLNPDTGYPGSTERDLRPLGPLLSVADPEAAIREVWKAGTASGELDPVALRGAVHEWRFAHDPNYSAANTDLPSAACELMSPQQLIERIESDVTRVLSEYYKLSPADRKRVANAIHQLEEKG